MSSRGGERTLASLPFIKAPGLWDQGPTLLTSFNLNNLLIVSSPHIVTLGIRDLTHEFGGYTIQYLTPTYSPYGYRGKLFGIL